MIKELKKINILFILALLCLLSMITFSYAKYIGEVIWNYYLESNNFYFYSSDLDRNYEQTIEINFVSINSEKKNVNEIDLYYTHPAFTFDNNELDGIWFAKFEITVSINYPTFKPNIANIKGQTVSKFHITALTFASNNGILNGVSRMIKNTDWNA